MQAEAVTEGKDDMVETFSAFFGQRALRRDAFPWLDDIRALAARLEGKTFACPSSPTQRGLRWTLITHDPNEDWTKLLEATERMSEIPLEYVIELRFEVETPTLAALKKSITYDGIIRDDEYHDLWRSFIRFTLETEISIVVLAMDLTAPGSSVRGDYLLQIGDYRQVNGVGYAYLEGPFEYAVEQGLPAFQHLEFEEVWSYLLQVNGLREGAPDSPAGKLLCALTYLYADTGPSARFFKTVWACYGLEGFYSEGNSARGAQVSEKAAIFLNLDRSITARMMKLLYESRSKFIHGNKALSSALVEVNPPEGKDSLEEWDAEYAGAYFLAQTARRCIEKNINRQGFALAMTD